MEHKGKCLVHNSTLPDVYQPAQCLAQTLGEPASDSVVVALARVQVPGLAPVRARRRHRQQGPVGSRSGPVQRGSIIHRHEDALRIGYLLPR